MVQKKLLGLLIEQKKICFLCYLQFPTNNFGVGVGFNIIIRSTHVVEQLSFSMLPSILTFDFDFGVIFDFLGP